jgi:hypothetical protein
MPTNKPATVYLPTSVDEKPPKNRFYCIAIDDKGNEFEAMYHDGSWFQFWDNGSTDDVTSITTFWLKKVTTFIHTKEELEKLLSDVWDAAYDFRLSKSKEVRSIVGKNSKHFSDKETFIQSIIKP